MPEGEANTDSRVLYFVGCAANFVDPEIGRATVRVLEKSGIEPRFPDQECCGISELFYGNIKAFRKRAEFNLRSLDAGDADVVTACTTCALTLKQDYPRWIGTAEAERVARRTYDIMEYLLLLEGRGGPDGISGPPSLSLLYHAPCHLKALGRRLVDERLGLMRRIPGVSVEEIDRGCCGMGGTFGLKRTNYAKSLEIGRPLFEGILASRPDRVVTDCFGCRLQIEEGTGLRVTHPVLVIDAAYGE